jgi:nicotinamide-nucleotide amidase
VSDAPADDALLDLAVRVGTRLRARGARVATAESCTGGWIAKALTDVPGSSEWVEGGLVTYGNAAKEGLAGVAAATLRRAGAVSEDVVREMAMGALARMQADVAVAVSGIAGPGGGSAEKPVGTVWFAWALRRNGIVSVRTRHARFPGDREAVRRRTVAVALEGLLVDD